LGLSRNASASSSIVEQANGIQKSRLLIARLIDLTTSVQDGSARIDRLPSARGAKFLSMRRHCVTAIMVDAENSARDDAVARHRCYLFAPSLSMRYRPQGLVPGPAPRVSAWACSFLVSDDLRSAITGSCPRQIIVLMAGKHVGIYISPRCAYRIQLRLDGLRGEASPILDTCEALWPS
jgi:hypothetical protein